MIYTVTFNPSIDYIVKVKELNLGGVNRVQQEEFYPGGKGINVSLMLKNLGVESMALGFIAGFTGREIEKRLNKEGCSSKFIVSQDGVSRINVKVKASEESEINGAGPRLKEDEIQSLYNQLKELKKGDILVLAGSIPSSLDKDTYEKICEGINEQGVHIVVDATKELLLKVLRYKPFLIKPNYHELEELFNTKLFNEEDIIEKGKKLQEMGARNVLISMAGDGAILISEDGRVFTRKAPKGEVINSVGAGDSMVAGFLAGYLKKKDFQEAFNMAVAAGSASAFSSWIAKGDKVLEIYRELCN